MKALFLSAAACLLVPAALEAQPAPTSIESLAQDGFAGTLARYGNLYVASQPYEAGLERMAAAGVVAVINLRTPREMEELGFDESALAERLGMRYVEVPQGGSEYPATPDALQQVSEAIAAAGDAPVLLHCASSARASHMFAAWLHGERDMPLNDAITLAREIGFAALRVEGLLGTTFVMDMPPSD